MVRYKIIFIILDLFLEILLINRAIISHVDMCISKLLVLRSSKIENVNINEM